MSRRTDIDKPFDEEPDRTVSYAVVLNAKESDLNDIRRMLESVPGLRVIYQKVALYDLFITPYPPSSWKEQSRGE